MRLVHDAAMLSNFMEQFHVVNNFWISLFDKLFKINDDTTLQGDIIRLDARGRWQRRLINIMAILAAFRVSSRSAIV